MTATLAAAIGGTLCRWRRKVLTQHALREMQDRGAGTYFCTVFDFCVYLNFQCTSRENDEALRRVGTLPLVLSVTCPSLAFRIRKAEECRLLGCGSRSNRRLFISVKNEEISREFKGEAAEPVLGT
jgi:hypothetical protein